MQVYISYCDADEYFAQQLAEQLTAWGYIPLSNAESHEVDNALYNSEVPAPIILGILTPEALENPNVQDEWTGALIRERPLILLSLRAIQEDTFPYKYFQIQRIDLLDEVQGIDQLKQTLESFQQTSNTTVSNGSVDGSSYIFLSYSHSDSEYARQLAKKLEEEGFDIWMDEKINYGDEWSHVIQEKLDSCEGFIVLMTPRSYKSKWVQNELNRAMRLGKKIFPILLEGDEPWLTVEAFQFVDVRDGSLPSTRFYENLAESCLVSIYPAIIYKAQAVMQKLASREWTVIALLSLGYTNREIGEKLIISPPTVKYHITRIYNKLEVYTRGSAMMWFKEQIELLQEAYASARAEIEQLSSTNAPQNKAIHTRIQNLVVIADNIRAILNSTTTAQ